MVGSIKLFYLCKSDVSAVQGHPRSFILVPIESSYATILVRHSNFGPILHPLRRYHRFCANDPIPFHPNFWGVPVGPDCPRLGQPEHKS